MLEQFIRRHPLLLAWAYRALRWLRPLREHPFTAVPAYVRLFFDWRRYLAAGGRAAVADFYPCLFDRVETTPIDPHYFYQAAWAFRGILRHAPSQHVDIGSDVRFVGMLSQAIPLTFVDIRPLRMELPSLDCRAGSVLALPYANGAVRSLSCLHVIEHIGLGRYGDPLDPQGSAKACRELARVLAPGGRLYLSTPIGRSRVQFNGQRVQSVQEVLSWFSGVNLVEMAIVDTQGIFLPGIDPQQADRLACQAGGLDFALGCFVFERPKD
ncbi:MAG: DUF268 domain-containing protein [Betaproteobacteria bacterium]|nr:DUF268 domain-containing protein [Betaproteobacteria bacterium]